MSYFVRIDRDTIESNPNYGIRNMAQVGPKEVLLSIYIDPEKVDMQNINQANFTFYGYEYKILRFMGMSIILLICVVRMV
ncbi:MAG TPA: hypothetical protein PKU94_08190 [Candidatus Hydrothermia bacterium]|nr:hypothetical protein [Candidatus Hydrothermia bacterium]